MMNSPGWVGVRAKFCEMVDETWPLSNADVLGSPFAGNLQVRESPGERGLTWARRLQR